VKRARYHAAVRDELRGLALQQRGSACVVPTRGTMRSDAAAYIQGVVATRCGEAHPARMWSVEAYDQSVSDGVRPRCSYTSML
jgi:hypothetical protein